MKVKIKNAFSLISVKNTVKICDAIFKKKYNRIAAENLKVVRR